MSKNEEKGHTKQYNGGFGKTASRNAHSIYGIPLYKKVELAAKYNAKFEH